MRRALVLLLLAAASAALASDTYKDGWTPNTIRDAVGACTDALVDGAWENTKRDQGIDPKRQMTPELRKQLEPQIDAFRRLCDCTVRETAKKYGAKDYERQSDVVQRYTVELVQRGTCKGPQ
ncbi:MAG TPA: hypothetical protein VMS22_09765 [Candidatus Eisenbacteria bacterium]|nr:hypothetical protein [Candidatus Eisenbacteria bacterium]